MACTTRYKIEYNGESWYVSEIEKAELWRRRGATVTAETTRENYADGIPMGQLGSGDLDRLEDLARANDWEEVMLMVRDQQQKLEL